MKSIYYELFELISREHGVILLDTELQEIVSVARQSCWKEIAMYGNPEPGKWYLVSDTAGTHFAAYMEHLGFVGANGEAYEGYITHWAELPPPPDIKKEGIMKTGVELIRAERDEQIEKHGFTTDHDDAYFNEDGELKDAALFLLTDGVTPYPEAWDPHWKKKAAAKGRVEKLVVAGALIAAEIDRLQRRSTDR